jgi:hypothetical protein
LVLQIRKYQFQHWLFGNGKAFYEIPFMKSLQKFQYSMHCDYLTFQLHSQTEYLARRNVILKFAHCFALESDVFKPTVLFAAPFLVDFCLPTLKQDHSFEYKRRNVLLSICICISRSWVIRI